MACAPSMKDAQKAYTHHGFMTFPHFLDNNFIEKGKPDLKFLDKWLRRYGCGLIRFAVAPDKMLKEAVELKRKWSDIHWIWPLHSRHEDISEFEWVGYPHDPPRRDYDLKTFFDLTEGKKRWYLGFHEGQDPSMLLYFDGFDTTIPSFYAMKHKMWHSWNKSENVGDLLFNYHEIIEYNVMSIKRELKKVFLNNNDAKLTDFLQYTPGMEVMEK